VVVVFVVVVVVAAAIMVIITDKNKRPSLISISDNIYCAVIHVSAYLLFIIRHGLK
jgi:hypothetical protein